MIASLRALGWVARDTLRQALRSAASWLMLAGSAACIIVCLLTPLAGPAAVYALQAQLAGWGVHVAALLLALILTAGMLPAFLAPCNAGDFSGLRDATGNPIVIYDPATTVGRSRLAFPNNVIPQDRIDPVARQILSQWFFGSKGAYVPGSSQTL